MKYILIILISLFISSQAIALDSFEVINKGKIIAQTTHTLDIKGRYSITERHRADAFFVIYKKALFKCNTLFDKLTCMKLDSRPALDARNKPIPD